MVSYFLWCFLYCFSTKNICDLTILFWRTGAIPKRISFFLWRLANQCLPTDDIVQSVGIFHAEPLAGAVPRELGSCFTAWLRSWDCLDAVPWVRSYLPQTSGAVYFITFDKQLLLEPIWSSCYINCLIHFLGAVDCEKQASLWRSDPTAPSLSRCCSRFKSLCSDSFSFFIS